jgi:hypothetical protein
MAHYYVNRQAQANGDHEVHNKTTCPPQYFPAAHNAIFLGDFSNCQQAVVAARAYFTQVNGCYYCSNYCHTQ